MPLNLVLILLELFCLNSLSTMKISHTNTILHTNVKTCKASLPTLMILWLELLIAYSFCTDISPRGKKVLQ